MENYIKNPLWSILVETVQAMVMYPHHKAYTREVILHERPDTTLGDLVNRLGIPTSEALVILYELQRRDQE